MNKNFNNFCDSANDEQEYPKIRQQRTLTNTFFEIIIGLLLLILWGGIVYKWLYRMVNQSPLTLTSQARLTALRVPTGCYL